MMVIQLGPLPIRLYGILLMLGAVAGAWVSGRQARRQGEKADLVWDGLTWVLVGGILGARLWHILTPPPSMVAQGLTAEYYLTHPLAALAIWKGGLGIPGAVIGGVVGLYGFARRRSLRFGTWLDIAAPGLALGQAIGRWGNFVNQELYGAPTDLPWAITVDPHHRLPGFETQATYHPLFLYESLWNLLNAFFLIYIGRRFAGRLRPGDLFLVYLITYPLGRFLLEFLRLDSAQVGGINVNQTLMLVVGLAASGSLFLRHRAPDRKERPR